MVTTLPVATIQAMRPLYLCLLACCIGPGEARTVSVRSYGAKGDGFTDDAHAIESAIAALNGSGTVLLPAPGEYAVSRAVVLRGHQPTTLNSSSPHLAH